MRSMVEGHAVSSAVDAGMCPSTSFAGPPPPLGEDRCARRHNTHPGYFAVQRSDWLSIHALQLPFARSRTRAM